MCTHKKSIKSMITVKKLDYKDTIKTTKTFVIEWENKIYIYITRYTHTYILYIIYYIYIYLEKETATHSSVLAWKIPGRAEPGGLPSMGSHRVGHDWSDVAAYIYDILINTLLLINILYYWYN